MSVTQCRSSKSIDIPDNIPEVEYPPEEIERLDKLREVMEARLATGELELTTIDEYTERRQLSGRCV